MQMRETSRGVDKKPYVNNNPKTVIEKLLVENYPNEFKKLQQVTTRAMREGEVQGYPYKFISQNEYDDIQENLIGKTNVNGQRYGTIMDLDDNKFNTVILNRMGIDNFKNQFPTNNCDIEYIILMVDSRSTVERDNRDINFVMDERWSIMEVMDLCVVHNPPEYKTVEEVREKIITFFNKHFQK